MWCFHNFMVVGDEENLVCSECGYIVPSIKDQTDKVSPLNSQVGGNHKNDGGSADYYKLPPNAKELQDLIEAKNMNFAVGNIFKAAYRMDEEGTLSNKARDLRKIRWFADRELKRIEAE